MGNILSLPDRLTAHLSNLATIIAGVLCLMMSLHIVVDVSLRFFLQIPLPGTVAIVSNYYMVAVTFLPLALVERMGAHISVEIVTERFGPRVQYHLQALTWALSLAIAVLLCIATWSEATGKLAVSAYVMESGYRLYLWPAHFFLPIGFGLLALNYALRLLGYLTGLPAGGKNQLDPVSEAEPRD